MGASGQISGRGSKGHHTFTLALSEGNYDINANTSPVTYTFTLTDDNDWYWSNWGSNISYSLKINTTTITGTIPNHSSRTQQIRSSSVTITHEDDGNKTISYSFSVSDSTGQTYTCGTANASGTLKLTTIPRASSMSLSPANPVTTSTIIASITRASSSFTHDISTSYNNRTYNLATNVGTSANNIQIPAQLRNDMKSNNVASVVLPITLTTKNGSSTVGTKEYSLTVSVPTATITCNLATVSCRNNITWTLSNTDTEACTYRVTRQYANTEVVVDQDRTTSPNVTSKEVSNGTFESKITSSPATGVITVTVITYSGTANVGSGSTTYDCTIPLDYYKPTLSNASRLSRVNKVPYDSLAGITYLAGFDGAQATITEGKDHSSSADIRSRTVTVSGNKASGRYSVSESTATISTSAFSSSDTDYEVTVIYRITDTRGRYAEASWPAITIRGYAPPTFDTVLVQRVDNSGNPYSEGTRAKITASASAHTIKNTSNAELNQMSSIKYMLGSSGTQYNGTVSELNGSVDAVYSATTLRINTQYTFNIIATDAIGKSTTVSYLLPKAVVTLSLHKDTGVGLGTTAMAGYISTGIPFLNKIDVDGSVYADSSVFVKPETSTVPSGTPGMKRNGVYGTTGYMYMRSEGEGYPNNPLGIISVVGNSTKQIVSVDSSNNVTFNGSLSGNATTAGSATTATTASKLGSSNMGSSNQPIYLSGGSPTLGSKYIPISDSNTADGEYKFQNASYAPDIKDTASGIGCANKGSRYLINELLVDGIVAPLGVSGGAYTEHNMNTRSGTIQFYKYSGNSDGQWTGLTKTAYIDTSGIYHPQVSRTDTYMLAGLVGVAISATQLRVQIPVPSGYSDFTPALVSGQTTANLDYNGTDASFTFSAVAKLDMNPASVSVTLTTSGLTAYRTYGFRNGRVSITLT